MSPFFPPAAPSDERVKMTETGVVESPAKKYDWKFRLLLAIVPRIFFYGASLLYRTCRIELFGKEHEDQFLREGKPILFVSWHQGLLFFAYHFRFRDGIVMVSRSKDGELIARTVKRLGFMSARGSSSRGGKDAMNTMIDIVNRTHCSAGLVADGPRGPFGVAKIGIIKIAQETGLPLIPVIVWAKRKILFKNWDRTLLALPFTRIAFYYEEPIWIPKDATPERMEQARVDLEDTLNRMHRHAREYFGEK
jgi:hypothetical protein